jgi:hypothetical protein
VNLIEREVGRRLQNRVPRSSVLTTARAAASHHGRDRHA